MAGSDLIGVLVGGIIGLTGSFAPHWWAQRRAGASARALARAYISGILEMEKKRKYEDFYRKNLQQLQSGQTTSFFPLLGIEDNRDDMIQSTLIGQIGSLEPDVARDLVTFGMMLGGLRVDLRTMARGELESLAPHDKIDFLERDLQLWAETIALGNDLVGRLR